MFKGSWKIFGRLSGLVIIGIILTACTKTNTPNELEDNILHTVPVTPLALSTVMSWETENGDGCTVQVPFPEDSVISIGLDIDKDDYNDFLLNVSHNRFVGDHDCGDCSIFEYQITLSGTNENNYISFNSIYTWEPIFYSNGDTVQLNSMWNKEVFLFMRGGCDRWLMEMEDSYIGFKHNYNYGWIRIAPLPNNGIEIKEYAINLTDGKPIRAGQKN